MSSLPKRVLYNGKIPSSPLNFKVKDEVFFKPHYDYKLLKPYLRKISSGMLFKTGIAVDNYLTPFPESLPWAHWANNYTKRYYLGSILKAAAEVNIGLRINNKKLVVVFNVFSDNYYHWITEVLPKMVYLKNRDSDYCFLLPSNYRQDYQESTIKTLNVKVQYFSNNCIYFRNLHFFSGFSEYPGYYEPQSIFSTRSLMLKSYLNNNSNNIRNDFVYVSRNKATRRKVINEDELKSIILKYNFKVYYFEEMTFEEIVQVSTNAKILVSIHGAALTNMIFMKEGSKVLELVKENVIQDKCYFFLAGVLGLNYYYQNCKSNKPEESHVYADIYVNCEVFEENLKLILTKPS